MIAAVSAAVAVVLVGALLGAPAGRPVAGPERPHLSPRSGRLAPVAVAAVAAGAVWPPLALVVGGGAVVIRRRRKRTRARRRHAEVVAALPDAIDLLTVATSAGRSLASAFDTVTPHLADGPVADAFGHLVERRRLGSTFVPSVMALDAELGPPARDLVTLVVAADRDGTAISAALGAAAAEARRRHRTELEQRARRLPVLVLVPLVVCVLPAFALLTVVPLLAGSFDRLPGW